MYLVVGQPQNITIKYLDSKEDFSEFDDDFHGKRESILTYCRSTIDKKWVDFISPTFIRSQMYVLKKIIKTRYFRQTATPRGDILVFVSGIAMAEAVKNAFSWERKEVNVIIVHSTMDRENNFGLNRSADSTDKRLRLIVATNVIESAVTIPDLDVVFCLGSNNVKVYDESNLSRSTLVNKWISQPSAQQRAGRTGRVRPGIVYRLYPKALYDEIFTEKIPSELHNSPLHDVIVNISSFQDSNINNNNNISGDIPTILKHFPEPLDDTENVNKAIQELVRSK